MPSSPEEAVRTYLRALRDPASVRDESHINTLREALAAADDPLERLRLRSQLERAQAVDMTALEQGFAENAKAWAQEHGISPDAFAAEGIPARVLRAAGLAAAARRRGRGGPSRGTRVTRDDVRRTIPRRPFTIGELAERSGASLGTIRTVIRELLDSGEIEALGTQEDHSGPGRAPTIYRRV